ncbi:MAG TPA: transglutaminase domain-containing protein [Puia sp.]|nr:transglutaminase domain-containing protein [Puia sp.]
MKKNRTPLTVLSLLISIVSFSQQAPSRFSSVDSFAITVKYKGSLDSLTKQLTAPYSEQLFKARAVFKWITENIGYDYNFFNKYYYKGKDPKTYKCRDDEDCEAKKTAWQTKYIDKVLRKKKAVCYGYAMLFKRMCDIAGLKSEVIPGYTRSQYYQVGSSGSLDHAWNSVLIDSTYYLLDPTWAAGGCMPDGDGKLLFYTKYFKEYYWLTPPNDFARNHYPQDAKWTLIPNYTKDKFSANPYYDPAELMNIRLVTPNSGIINAKKGDTIRFKFDYLKKFTNLQINSNVFHNPDIWVIENISKRKTIRRLDTLAVKKQQYIKYRREGDLCEFEYVVTDNSLYYLDILFDSERMMRFNVRITE